MAISFEKAAAIIESSFAPCVCRCERQDDRVTVHIFPRAGQDPAHSVQVSLARLATVRSTAQVILEIRQALSASPEVSLHSMVNARGG